MYIGTSSCADADLWTLAGVVAIESMGGPIVPWISGRRDKTAEDSCPPNGRLPDAAQGEQHIRDVFYRMGFNDRSLKICHLCGEVLVIDVPYLFLYATREIVALIGAHTIGRCHADRSGFVGPWTYTPTRFSNQLYVFSAICVKTIISDDAETNYQSINSFVQLVKQNWTSKTVNGQTQYKDDADELMMLPADLALIKDPKFKEIVGIYAQDKQAFFNDFTSAFGKLLELGVDRSSQAKL